MPKLFISYRRNDSADATGRLQDRLKSHFGEESIFYDVNSVPIGVDFYIYIGDAVGQCDALLAVIGETWVNASDNGQRRLDNPDDLVRIEIETALARDIPVIPVLVANASMPTEGVLPGDLKGLARRNAAAVRPGADFDAHAKRLIYGLERLFSEKQELEGRVEKANHLADDDPEIALVPSRMALEVVIRKMYKRRTGEPPGGRTLEQLSQRLVGLGIFPSNLDVTSVIERLDRIQNRFSTKKFTKSELSRLLADVMAVLQWYMTVEQPNRVGQNHSLPPSRQTDISTSGSIFPASRLAIVPKGLRSFDAKDTDFFLDLLPGPRDKNGLPESIRFWKHRIEERDEATFTVGVLYGPSGCGKSSLVKAGLLPRLADHVVSVYVEATAADTESRLLNGLRKRCPHLPKDLDLTGTILALRQGQGLRQEKKVFIVLDQFEQWLHAMKGKGTGKLVQALRQCDGERVQAIVMVRDDFWLAVSRFLRELDIRLTEGQNSALVDLFDTDHARNVLAAFGRAFRKLPDNSGDTSKEQKEFLKQAVSGLAQEGKVICVRLALFAEMMKGKAWTTKSLKKVGGTEGIGVTFLEETFSAATAPPEHRYHQTAAVKVLKSLLPEFGTEIKGHMRSYAELLKASDYGSHPKDFDDLIRILDGEIRLITPTDPEGKELADASTSPTETGQKYYQLTHDYLVPSLREWITRKQKETSRGRAELLMSVWSSVWNTKPENRNLPGFQEWLRIQLVTRKRDWTEPQHRMMRAARRYYFLRGTMLAVLLVFVTVTGLAIRGQGIEQRQATHAAGLVEAVVKADTAQVPEIVRNMAEYRKWADPLLQNEFNKAESNSPQKLHASLALVPVDSSQVDYLYGRMLDAKSNEVPVIVDALTLHKDALLNKLWAVVQSPEKGKESQRLRAASALAKYVPDAEQWESVGALVVNDLVLENPVFLGQWSEAFRPVKNRLLFRLSDIFRDQQSEQTAERNLATNLLADYAADNSAVLADLLMDADEKQFAVIFPKLRDRGDECLPVLIAEIDQQPPAVWPSSDERREKLAKRQANAAVALLRLNQPARVWKLLAFHPVHDDPATTDPRVRSYLIHRLTPLGVDPQAIIQQLDDEPDITVRRALLLSIGEFSEQALSLDDRKKLLPKLQEMYQTNADPGLHAASEWLLRQWNDEEWLKEINEEWANDKERRDQRLEDIQQSVMKDKKQASPQWYFNSQGQTLVVIPGPVTFTMGSPETERGRLTNETQHQWRIRRTFVLAEHSVTLKQYRKFEDGYGKTFPEGYVRRDDLPVVGLSWYRGAKYCNWLSEQEGLQACYTIKGDIISLNTDYLSLDGYRLPTEAEMEYATRAGATSSRYFGETDDLLPNYAWFNKNSQELIQPIGLRKPNDLGLFDVHGNVPTWCQESYQEYPVGVDVSDDKEDNLTVKSTDLRVVRGGSFMNPSSMERSAYRGLSVPGDRSLSFGFRLARTLPLVPLTALPLTPEKGRN